METARADLLASTAFPKQVWRKIWSNNLGRPPQPRDPPPHRRLGYLPWPNCDHPPGRRGPGRTTRAFGPQDAAPSPWTSWTAPASPASPTPREWPPPRSRRSAP